MKGISDAISAYADTGAVELDEFTARLEDSKPLNQNVVAHAAQSSATAILEKTTVKATSKLSSAALFLAKSATDFAMSVAMKNVDTAIAGSEKNPLSIDELRSMDVVALLALVRRYNRESADEVIKMSVSDIKASLEVTLEANLRKTKLDVEKMEEQAKQKDESLKSRVVKWVEPAITFVTGVVTVATGVLKLLTFNPTGLTDIAAGFCDMTSAGLKVALIFDPENEDMQKAAGALEMASMALGLVGGVAGGMKFLGKKLAEKLVKKLTVEVMEAGGKKLIMKNAIEIGQKAMTDTARDVASKQIKSCADDIAELATDAYKKELNSQLETVIKRGVERLARSPKSGWKEIAQRMIDLPKDAYDGIVKKSVQLSLRNFDPEMTKKAISESLSNNALDLMKKGGKKGDDLAESLTKRFDPKLTNKTVDLLSGPTLALSITQQLTSLGTTALDKEIADGQKLLADLDIQAAQIDEFLERVARRVQKSRELLTTTMDSSNRSDKTCGTSIQSYYDVIMQAQSPAAAA